MESVGGEGRRQGESGVMGWKADRMVEGKVCAAKAERNRNWWDGI